MICQDCRETFRPGEVLSYWRKAPMGYEGETENGKRIIWLCKSCVRVGDRRYRGRFSA